MTTHLVIADDDTLDAMAVESAEKSHVHHVNHREAYTDNGDTWLFRTPDAPRLDIPTTCDFVYLSSRSIKALSAIVRALKGHPLAELDPRVLPLIAACDLLGIEELIIYAAEPQDGVIR